VLNLATFLFHGLRSLIMPVSEHNYARVGRVLAHSLGVDEDQIAPTATLQGDLGAESIDFLDIVFRLEREFGFKVPRGELFPETVFGEDPTLARDGLVTDEGMRLLRSCMPFAELSILDRDRQLGAVTDLFTVDFLVRYVDWKLARGDASASVPTSPTNAPPQTFAAALMRLA
jgi:acyl carrier protein